MLNQFKRKYPFHTGFQQAPDIYFARGLAVTRADQVHLSNKLDISNIKLNFVG